MNIEWDIAKAAENERKHGVSFTEAAEAFSDPRALELIDDEHSEDEDRYSLIGFSSRCLLFVVYTVRGEAYRIIHARKAGLRMQKDYAERYP